MMGKGFKRNRIGKAVLRINCKNEMIYTKYTLTDVSMKY